MATLMLPLKRVIAELFENIRKPLRTGTLDSSAGAVVLSFVCTKVLTLLPPRSSTFSDVAIVFVVEAPVSSWCIGHAGHTLEASTRNKDRPSLVCSTFRREPTLALFSGWFFRFCSGRLVIGCEQ